MAAGRKIAYYRTYVDGNTVRREETIIEEPAGKRAEKPKVSRRTRNTREKALQVNIGYALFLTLITGTLLFGCVRYLQIQAQVTATMENINRKESELNALKAENDAEYNRVVSSVDLESVRRTAMEELGMVYASENQVVVYEGKDADYVRQYQDVPEDTAEENVESKVAAFFGR